MKFKQLTLLSIFICCNLINAKVVLEEKPCPEIKTFDFSLIEEHENDQSEKWVFLSDIYGKYRDALFILTTIVKGPMSNAERQKFKAEQLKDLIMRIGKPHDINAIMPGIKRFSQTAEKLYNYDDFIVDDMKRLSTPPKTILYWDLGEKPENYYSSDPARLYVDLRYYGYPKKEIADYIEFFDEAQNLLSALYEIRRLIRENEEFHERRKFHIEQGLVGEESYRKTEKKGLQLVPELTSAR